MKRVLRSLPIVLVFAVVAAALVYGFWPTPTLVEIVDVTRGDLLVTVNDDGITRIREKYIVSSPVSGKLFRVDLEEGDEVLKGKTVLARIEPGDPSLLDARALAESEARVRAAAASGQQAEAALTRAEEAHKLTSHEYKRALSMIQSKAISASDFERAEHRERMAQADVRSAEFGVAVANFELEMAKAALIRVQPTPADGGVLNTLTITSPINGRVLRVLQENAGVVSPGAPLLEIGDPRDLEMVVDVLSTDAVKIEPGAKVEVQHWGGEQDLEGAVRLIEPAAFLKISALGVEEQRVNVVADFSSPFDLRQSMGDGYRIEARIVIHDLADVITAPSGALVRDGDGWMTYQVIGGQAVRKSVEIGLSDGDRVEIREGLAPGDKLILYPSDQIHGGALVRGE